MRSMFRTLLCVGALALMLCSSVLAVETAGGISIELNGEPLTFTDAAPQIVNDRTYLPFRAVFTALGFADEDITYQEATKTVSAVRDGLDISMVIGEKQVSVTKDGQTTVLDTDAPAFIDPQLGRTYVPARFVAEAAEYRVGWNGDTRTVIIDDVDAILEANKETYKVLDLYLDYGRTFQKKNYQVEGSYYADMLVGADLMEMGGTYSMLTEGSTKFDFKMRMEMGGSVAGADLSAAIPEGVDLEMRGDMDSGAFYFKSDALMTLMETGVENLWFKMDLAGMMDSMAPQTGMSYTSLMTMSKDLLDGMDGEAYIDDMVRSMALADTTMSAADQLAMLNAMLGDSAFIKDGSDYVAAYSDETALMSMTVHTTNGRATGYTVTLIGGGEEGGMAMDVSMKDNKMAAAFEVVTGDTVMIMEMDGTYTVTTKAPAGQPGEEAAVLDMAEMMSAGAATPVEPAA